MPRYDRMYAILARRAVKEGGIDVESFVDQALEVGISPERIQEMLLEDLANDGPLFGRFFRTLTGAAETAVLTAERQGFDVGVLAEDVADKRIAELRRIVNMDDALTEADPEKLAEIEQAGASMVEYTWIALMQNTCHLCLPLHGHSRTKEEWQELGVLPDTIHVNAGFVSKCRCTLVPRNVAEGRADLQAPLLRNKLVSDTGLKGSKRTARGVAQQDLDRAIAARDKALESEQGRRTLRLLGKTSA